LERGNPGDGAFLIHLNQGNGTLSRVPPFIALPKIFTIYLPNIYLIVYLIYPHIYLALVLLHQVTLDEE